jgi:uncharacterized protein
MLPVTVVIARTPKPGHEAELLAWANDIQPVAATYPGHLGAQIITPTGAAPGEVIVVFSFESAASLQAWETSEDRASWLRKLDGIVEGEARTHAVSGFESLFAHQSSQPVYPPPRWKTATVIALALYPMSLVLNWLLAPHLLHWNIWLRVALTTVIVVPYMAWVGVPYLTKWLRPWLHQQGPRSQ